MCVVVVSERFRETFNDFERSSTFKCLNNSADSALIIAKMTVDCCLVSHRDSICMIIPDIYFWITKNLDFSYEATDISATGLEGVR